METVLITGAAGDFEKFLAEAFIREGYDTYRLGGAGKGSLSENLTEARAELLGKTDKIDIYIDTADARDSGDAFTIKDGLDESVIRKLYEKNVLRPMRAMETFLPLLDAGKGRRVCFLTSAEASVNETEAVSGFGYNLSKAAMHNFFQMVSNKLTPFGYTMRVYDPRINKASPRDSAEGAFSYFTRRRGTEGFNPLRDDETRLVFRDAFGREHAW